MRIPITIKIPVNDAGRPSGRGLAKVVIQDLSDELERISVRVFSRRPSGHQLQRTKPALGREIRRTQASPPVVFQPRPQSPPLAARTMPRVRYSVKTFNITLAWPTFPPLIELWQKLTRLSKKNWLRAGAAILIITAAIVSSQLLGGGPHSDSGDKLSKASGQLPRLTRGTPDYGTILPAGKTIGQLGGWTRISPAKSNPVYTYVDKVGKVQINVSEQPLPKDFREDTTNKVFQLAKRYNATNKFTAGDNISVFVGSSDKGEQSVILAKDKLLILIKSSGPLSNNQWAAYISSLK